MNNQKCYFLAETYEGVDFFINDNLTDVVTPINTEKLQRVT